MTQLKRTFFFALCSVQTPLSFKQFTGSPISNGKSFDGSREKNDHIFIKKYVYLFVFEFKTENCRKPNLIVKCQFQILTLHLLVSHMFGWYQTISLICGWYFGKKFLNLCNFFIEIVLTITFCI